MGIILFYSSTKIKAQERRAEYRKDIDDGAESTGKKTLLSSIMSSCPEPGEEEHQTVTICQKLKRIYTEFGLILKKEIRLKSGSQHRAKKWQKVNVVTKGAV